MTTSAVNTRRRSEPVRVLVADDHDLYAEALCALLGDDDRIELVGRAADGAEAIALTREHRPHVVLMDVHMPRIDGVEATAVLTAEDAALGVVMLTSSTAATDIVRSAAVGAAGYLTKDADAATIKAEVMRAAAVVCPLRGIRAA